MNKQIYTIGFTKKTAEEFFELIKKNNITLIIDVRLNNTSQLSGFSKFPDIKYFLKSIAKCEYISDKNFAPLEITLNRYKKNQINWDEYVKEFNETMFDRDVLEYIKSNYSSIIIKENICFLCSEEKPYKCHRRLVSEKFKQVFDVDIKHI